MLKDRGKMKWNSLMLPEHVGKLREWVKEDSLVTKPNLDEQEYEKIQQIMEQAIHQNNHIAITYFENNQLHQFVGKIMNYDELTRMFKVVNKCNDFARIANKAIVNVKIISRENDIL